MLVHVLCGLLQFQLQLSVTHTSLLIGQFPYWDSYVPVLFMNQMSSGSWQVPFLFME